MLYPRFDAPIVPQHEDGAMPPTIGSIASTTRSATASTSGSSTLFRVSNFPTNSEESPMPKRILISSLIGAVALGGVAAGGIALASAPTPTELTLENGSARYAAPSDGGAGSFTYTVDASDDSGIRDLKVLLWPASSKLDPTAAELRRVESAKCHSGSDRTTRCTYTLKVTKREAAEVAKGTWYVSVLATAKDGDTTYVPRAATFDVTH